MEVLRPTRSSRMPILVLQILAKYFTPEELVVMSHLCRYFRQELTRPIYWLPIVKQLQLPETAPFQEFIKFLIDNKEYIKDPDLTETLPLDQQTKALKFITEYNIMNGQTGKSARRAIILEDSLARQLTTDAMSQVRGGTSPRSSVAALDTLGQLQGFTRLWIDHKLSSYMSSVDMSSLDPYVYYQERQFHADKFDIFLRQLRKQVEDYTNSIKEIYPQHAFKTVWEALISRLNNEVLFKLINYLCELNIDFVPSIFVCLQLYFDALLTLCPDSTEGFIGAPFAPWVEQCVHSQTYRFKETAEEKVREWNTRIESDEIQKEKNLWSNVVRTGEKTNFLSSFKRALWSAEAPSADNSMDMSITSLGSPTTEQEAQVAVLLAKVESIQSLLNLELVLALIDMVRFSFSQLRKFSILKGSVESAAKEEMRTLFLTLIQIAGIEHTQTGFDKAIYILNMYDPKQHRQVAIDTKENQKAVEPLALFAELINVSDLIQQTLHIFFRQELVVSKIVDPNDFASEVVNLKRSFEQMLDDKVAQGLNRGVDVLIDQIDFILMTEQLGSDFNPVPGTLAEIGPTTAASDVVNLVRTHITQLSTSLEKSVFEVFTYEVGMRLWTSICKHIKRSTISLEGAITLISDVNYYHGYIMSLKQRQLYPYYEALKQVSQLYLISPKDSKALGNAISDLNRFKGVIPSDELIGFMKRRQDWPQIKYKVEKVLYGFGECRLM